MKIVTISRRQFLSAAGTCVAGGRSLLEAQVGTLEQEEGPTLRSLSRFSDSLWCFDPVGLYVQPGETLRFVPARTGGITTLTAYHPENDNRELRIPEAAQPFDLGLPRRLFFDLKLTVEGTYDYFSKYQEVLGMVGRIIVGRPGGPGEKPWGYAGSEGSNPIYKATHKTAELLDSQEIMTRKTIPFPFDDMIPEYPLWD